MATKMRGTRSMGRGPGKTSMRTGGSMGSLRGRSAAGSPNLNRRLGVQEGAAKRAMARSGGLGAPGAPKKVASVRLTGPQAGMTEMTR